MAEKVEYTISLKDLFSKSIGDANSAADKFEGKLGKVSDKAKGLGSTFGKLGGIIAGAAAGLAVFDIGKGIIKAGSEMEQTRVQFETFTGSVEEGNKAISKLQKFAAATPFEDDQVISAGRQLLAFGTQVDELEPKLTKLGNISAATGKDFNELTSIYGKNKLSGIIQGEDLNQLVEAGIPVFDSFAKQLGVSTSQIRKMGADGKITFEMLDKAFDELGGKGGKWGDLMDKQSQTLGGLWSTLTSNVANMGQQLGEMVLPAIKNMVTSMGDGLTWVKQNIEKIIHVFSPLGKLFQPILDSVQKLGEKFGTVGSQGDQLESIFNKIGNVLVFLEPVFTKIGEGIGSLITSFGDLFHALGENKYVMGFVTLMRDGFMTVLDIAAKTLGGIADVITGALNGDWSKAKEGFGKLGTAIGESFNLTLGKTIGDGVGMGKANFFAEDESAYQKHGSMIDEVGKKNKDKVLGTPPPGAAKGKEASGISGSKPQNIYITIQKLIESQNITTTNLTEGATKIKDMVSEAIIMAVNDINLLASA